MADYFSCGSDIFIDIQSDSEDSVIRRRLFIHFHIIVNMIILKEEYNCHYFKLGPVACFQVAQSDLTSYVNNTYEYTVAVYYIFIINQCI